MLQATPIQEKTKLYKYISSFLHNIHTGYSTALQLDNYIQDRIICSPMKLNGIVADYAENKGGSKMHYVQITVNP